MSDGGEHRAEGGEAGADTEPLGDVTWIARDLGGYNDFAARLYLAFLRHCHRAVHVDDIGVTLLGAVAEASGLLDVVLVALALVVGNGVRGVDIAADTDGMIEAGNDQTITVHQLDILRGTRVCQCLVEVDANVVGLGHRQLVEGYGVLAVGTLSGDTDDLLQTGLLIVAHTAHKTGTTDIGTRHCPTRCLDDIRQALVLQLHRVVALESDLAFDGDTDGRLEGRTHAYLHNIIGLEREAAVAIDHVIVFQRKTESLGNLHACLGSRRIA